VCRWCHEGEHKGGDSAGRSTLGEEQHMIIWREVFWGVLGVEEGEEKARSMGSHPLQLEN
jgi:hypothetical protein